MPMYVVHRGGDANWVEGTSYVYVHAVAWNFDFVFEVLVRRIFDGVWVVSEDVTTGCVFGVDYVIWVTPWWVFLILWMTCGGDLMVWFVNDVFDVYGCTRILFFDDKIG